MIRNTNWTAVGGVTLVAILLPGAAVWSAAPSGTATSMAQGCRETMGNMSGMMSMMACCAPKGGGAQPGQAQQVRDAQRATVVIDDGYLPATINARAGKPLALTFVSKGASCANTVSIPSLHKTLTLKSGEERTVTFTPAKGTTTFSCAMGMYQGKVIAR